MSANEIDPDQIDTDELLVRRLLADQFPQWADLPVTAVPPITTAFRCDAVLVMAESSGITPSRRAK